MPKLKLSNNALQILEKRYLKKTRLDNIDNFEYSYRQSISEETIIEEKDLFSNNVIFKRIKKRKVYKVQDCIEIHLTEVTIPSLSSLDLNSRINITYELEIEVIKEHQDIHKIVKDFVVYILKSLQQNSILISNSEISNVKNMYIEYFGNLYSYLAQPETLTKNSLLKVNKEDYALTFKIDGLRNILLVDQQGQVYSISWYNNNMVIKSTNFYTKEFSKCILDCENINTCW